MTNTEAGLRRSTALAALILVLWGVWFLWLRPAAPGQFDVPAGLLGRWESSDHRYLDRFFQINADSVIWGQGEAQLAERLWGVETEETEGHPIVVLVTGDEVDSARRSPFFYDGIDSLYPVNRREVRWIKVESESRR